MWAAKALRPATFDTAQIAWPYAITIVGFHALLPLALVPWLFSWTGVLLVPLGTYLFGTLGINLGYHRLLTHRSFRCPKWFEHGLALLGTCSLQDTPVRWVAIHRYHHQHSDDPSDPHRPLAGFVWSHFGWLFVRNELLNSLTIYETYVRDILQDEFYVRLERKHAGFWIAAAHGFCFLLTGLAIGSWMTATLGGGVQFGLSLFVWGVVVRTVFVWHVTWSVNSLGHMWGYRNYVTGENSRNNWLVALLTNGEGWHNNHHADQRSAAHGHRWWEIDVAYGTICLLRLLGLVTDVVPRKSVPAKEPERAAGDS